MADMKVSPELLKKYDVAGPRYTSYPTAPVWTTDFTA
jgi:oxygen-independent coproporphyrinogen-3 oxidase